MIKELDSPRRIVLETPPDQAWLRSIREVEARGPSQSKFTDELAYDLEFLRQLTPILPPSGLVKAFYSRRIRRYLENVSQLIEEQ